MWRKPRPLLRRRWRREVGTGVAQPEEGEEAEEVERHHQRQRHQHKLRERCRTGKEKGAGPGG